MANVEQFVCHLRKNVKTRKYEALQADLPPREES